MAAVTPTTTRSRQTEPRSLGARRRSSTIRSARSRTAAFRQAGLMWRRLPRNSTAPQPSAVVIETTDASGHLTKALATLPNVALSQGIYRPIEPSDFYMTRADVRVDQFSDIDPAVAVEDPNNPGFLLCGCPVGIESALDWPMGVTFAFLDGSIDPADAPAAGIIASAETHTWHLFSAPPTLSPTSTSVSRSKKANGTASRPISTPQMALCTVR